VTGTPLIWSPDDLAVDEPRGLAVFFLSEPAVACGADRTLLDVIDARGFEVLRVTELDVADHDAVQPPGASTQLRAARAVVALDVLPQAPRPDDDRSATDDNRRITAVEGLGTRLVRSDLPPDETDPPIWATRSSIEAWAQVRALLPRDEVQRLVLEVRERLERFHRPCGAVRDMTRVGNRARVELVEWRSGHAVRKTFKPGAQRYLEHEVRVLRDLADAPQAPALLGVGDDHFVLEHYDDVWSGRVPKFLPLPLVRDLADFVRRCASLGYDPIDLTPWGNLVLDPVQGLKVLDFEFYHRRGSYPPEEAYALTGIPPDFGGSRPLGSDYLLDPYPVHWYPYTGLPIRSFLHDPAWLQRVKRLRSYPGIALYWKLRPRVLWLWRSPPVQWLVGHRVAARLRGRMGRNPGRVTR
jgi:hypothetical protein